MSVKTREGLVPIQFFFSTTQQRLLYYSLLSFLFNKVNFLSSSSLHYFTFTYQGSNRKLSSKRERKKMKIFSFIFRVWGVGTLLHGGNTHTHTHTQKRKKKEIFMIGYATHVPKLRCSGNEEGVFWGSLT